MRHPFPGLLLVFALTLGGCESRDVKELEEPPAPSATGRQSMVVMSPGNPDPGVGVGAGAGAGAGAGGKVLPPTTAAGEGRESGTGSAADTLPGIAFEQYRLDNGLNVILHVDDKMPAVNINLWYHVGSKNEAPGKTGFAHLFEHMMFQGSKHVEGEYIGLVERAGASMGMGGVNGTTNHDRTNYFQTVPTGSLEYILWLESDRMGYLLDSVTEDSFDNQRNVVKNEKRQGDNRPYASGQYIVAENMYPATHPYSHTVIGSMEDLDNASLQDVKDFFERYYAPNNASLVLSGSFDPEEAKRLIEKYFGPLPSGPPIVRQRFNVPKLERDIVIVSEERAPQPRLTLVWHAPPWFDEEEAPLDFAAEILGDGENSRLYRRLVRGEKLATSVLVYNVAREIAGLFHVQVTGIPGASLDRIRDIVAEELALLAREGPTAEEMQQRRAQHEYRFVTALERIGGFGGKADLLNSYWTYLREPGSFQRDHERYQAVTAEQVSASLGRWVTDAHRLEIRFLPDGSGRAGIADFDRTRPPAIAPSPGFSAPGIESATLDNGLALYVHRRGDLPKVEIALVVKRGDLGETPDNAGLSHLTAAAIDDGTRNRSALQIQSDLQALGTTFNTRGDKFGAVVGVSTLRKHLRASVDILADVVRNPTFPEDEVALTRELRINSIRQDENDPARLANRLFPRLLFTGAHPAGVSAAGTAESIATLDAPDLAANHDRFWRPNNAALVFVGDVTLEAARTLAGEFFGDWQPAELPGSEKVMPQPPGNTRIFLVDRQAAPQSQVRIGSLAPPRPDPEYPSLLLMNELLGGPFTNRLNLNLREDKGYSYGAYSYLVQRKDFGYWVALAGVETDSTAASLVEFRREIEGMSGAIPIGEDELDGLKTSMARSYAQNFETLGQVAREVTPLIRDDIPLEELQHYLQGVQAQTAADINTSARRHLDMDRAVVLVVGDLDIIEPEILALDWGEVYVLDEQGEVLRRGGASGLQR